MAFQKKTWTNRLAEYLTRRTLTDVTSGDVTTVEVARAEGEIYEDGDSLDADTMNDLEDRINDAFEEVGKGVGVVDTYDNVMDMISHGEIEEETFVSITDDSDDDSISAIAIDYDNTNSGMTATEVQGAIDELSTQLSGTDSDTITVLESNNHLVSDLTFYKKGQMVTFTMVGVTQILDQQWVSLGNVKSGMRPSNPIFFTEVDPNSNNAKCVLRISTDGTVSIFCYGGGAAITHALTETHNYQV